MPVAATNSIRYCTLFHLIMHHLSHALTGETIQPSGCGRYLVWAFLSYCALGEVQDPEPERPSILLIGTSTSDCRRGRSLLPDVVGYLLRSRHIHLAKLRRGCSTDPPTSKKPHALPSKNDRKYFPRPIMKCTPGTCFHRA